MGCRSVGLVKIAHLNTKKDHAERLGGFWGIELNSSVFGCFFNLVSGYLFYGKNILVIEYVSSFAENLKFSIGCSLLMLSLNICTPHGKNSLYLHIPNVF